MKFFMRSKKKTGSSGWIAIKLDMEKAYDRLEWEYIFSTLEKLGFCKKWIIWIRECITTVSFSVLVNGIPSDQFFPSRGIRQGDPLSPYLFILCTELLARQLQFLRPGRNQTLGVSPGHSRMRIPFLTFADDTMIFAKANTQACQIIKNVLNKYCSMSGQLVNYHKSAFQCTSNVSIQEISDFKAILAMESVSSLDSYLGCPMIDKRVNSNTFRKIISNMNNQLSKWKANSISQAGRTILMKSCLATKQNHQMQSFTLPTSTLWNLDKICRNFFWNREPQAKTPNLIGWDKICKP